MIQVLGDLIGRSVLVCVDDMIVYTRAPAQHMVHLREMLYRMRQHKLYIKLSKCEFNKPSTNHSLLMCHDK
jgi:hypothetical protein